MSFLSTVFWGALVISFLVFIHEAGHYVASRAFGVRVTEFSLGLRSKCSLSRVSKRRGTRFYLTAIPLGGYVMISGMNFKDDNPDLELVLAVVNGRGQASLSELTKLLDGSEERAHTAVATLVSWGSLMGFDAQGFECTFDSPHLAHVATMKRDSSGNTIYDKPLHLLSSSQVNEVGEPFHSNLTPHELLMFDRSHTYHGLCLWQRLVVLLAGITVNLVFAITVFLGVFCLMGVPVTTNTIAEVAKDSQAHTLGVVPGDTIVRIGDTYVSSFEDIVTQLNAHHDGLPFELELSHAVEDSSRAPQNTVINATFPKDHKIFGIGPTTEHRVMSVKDACSATVTYLITSARGIANLFNPWHVKETLDSSVSVIGIAAITKEAAGSGLAPLLFIFAGISLSLGLINLVPIPPLDGGKILLEIIGGIRGKEVSLELQQKLSLVGAALLALLFFYMIVQDVIRFVL